MKFEAAEQACRNKDRHSTRIASVKDLNSEMSKLKKDVQCIAKFLFAEKKDFGNKKKCWSYGEDGYVCRNFLTRRMKRIEMRPSRGVEVTRNLKIPCKSS